MLAQGKISWVRRAQPAVQSAMDPMEYLEQAKANAQAMQAAAVMQENTASIAASLRARMEQIDAMAAGPVTSVGSSLSAEDRHRFGLDTTQKASMGGIRPEHVPVFFATYDGISAPIAPTVSRCLEPQSHGRGNCGAYQEDGSCRGVRERQEAPCIIFYVIGSKGVALGEHV